MNNIRFVLAPILIQQLGFSKGQIESFRLNGYWREDEHYRRLPTPKKQIVYDLNAIQQWMWQRYDG